MKRDEAATWKEYDMAAEWCAKRGIRVEFGTELYEGIGSDVMELIDDDPDAFNERINATAYALAMERVHAKFGDGSDE